MGARLGQRRGQATGPRRNRSTCWAALAMLMRRLASRTTSDSGVGGVGNSHSGRST